VKRLKPSREDSACFAPGGKEETVRKSAVQGSNLCAGETFRDIHYMQKNKHSKIAREAIASKSGGRMMATYLVLSYAYYGLDISIVADSDYDALCKELNKDDVWEAASAHPHAQCVKRSDLNAGTGYSIANYPLQVELATKQMVGDAGLAA
jgi:hypothetical protein